MEPNTFPDPVGQLQQCRIASSGVSGRARCERGWNWHPPFMPDYDIWYVVSGRGTFRLNGETHAIAGGSCLLLRPGDEIAAEQDPDHRLTVLFVHFRMEPAEPGLLPRIVTIRDTYWFEQLLNRLLSIEDAEPHRLYRTEFELTMKTVLCHLLLAQSALEHRQPKHRQTVKKLIQYIREHLSEPLDRQHLASIANLSPRYLSMLFKQETGFSLKSYIARSRIERAARLLAESTMNISRIAETLGYSDVYFFSRQFRQFIGESPTRYRERIRSANSHYGSASEAVE
mgnify:CR=1 FL=1